MKSPSNIKASLHSQSRNLVSTSDYQKCLNENTLTQSMSRKATCLDNASIESFFYIVIFQELKQNQVVKFRLNTKFLQPRKLFF